MLEMLQKIPADFWFVLSEMAPYLLLGFFVAGVLAVLIRPETIERHLGGKGVLSSLSSTFKATIFGIPLPWCFICNDYDTVPGKGWYMSRKDAEGRIVGHRDHLQRLRSTIITSELIEP